MGDKLLMIHRSYLQRARNALDSGDYARCRSWIDECLEYSSLLSQAEHPMLLSGMGVRDGLKPDPRNKAHCEWYEFGKRIRAALKEVE